MASVLGIDAAWTAGNPSGVALVRFHPGLGLGMHSHCTQLPEAFISLAGEDAAGWAHPDNWERPVRGGVPEPAPLLRAAEILSGERVSVVSVDMPLAYTPITKRRVCDNAVSSKFLEGRGAVPTRLQMSAPANSRYRLRELLDEPRVPT